MGQDELLDGAPTPGQLFPAVLRQLRVASKGFLRQLQFVQITVGLTQPIVSRFRAGVQLNGLPKRRNGFCVFLSRRVKRAQLQVGISEIRLQPDCPVKKRMGEGEIFRLGGGQAVTEQARPITLKRLGDCRMALRQAP